MSNALLSSVVSVLALIVTLGILVTVHEFGHFWVARRFGVKVLRFSVGFGRPLWSRRDKGDGTEYVVAAIPLGGYVRMLDEREGDVAPSEVHRAFNRQPVSSRIAIVAAGPFFNFLFAGLAYTLMFMVGVTGIRPLLDEPVPDSMAATAGFQKGDQIIAVDEYPTPTLQAVQLALVEHGMDRETVDVRVQTAAEQTQVRRLDFSTAQQNMEDAQLFTELGFALWSVPAVVGQVLQNSPAEQAGLMPNDQIIAINDTPIDNWQQLLTYVQGRPGEAINIQVARDGKNYTLQMTPEAIDTPQGPVGRIGISGRDDMMAKLQIVTRYGPLQSFLEGVQRTWDMSLFTLRMLWRMLIGKASLENISGPITIAQFAGQSASIGWLPFLSFLALVSVSLGVLNLLPIPVLDGGHLFYYFIELIKGSPLSDFAQEFGQRLGVMLLVILMSLALFNDLARLLG
jgi:regulator of sigma E protease